MNKCEVHTWEYIPAKAPCCLCEAQRHLEATEVPEEALKASQANLKGFRRGLNRDRATEAQRQASVKAGKSRRERALLALGGF